MAISLISRFARPVEDAGTMEAARFRRDLLEAVPYRIRTGLTDRAVAAIGPSPMARSLQLISRKGDAFAVGRILDRVGRAHGSEHRLTKASHPWSEEDQATVQWTVGPTRGQVERMSRTTQDATINRHHHDSHDQLRAPLAPFVDANNHDRRLKALTDLTPYGLICQAWTKEPQRLILDPISAMRWVTR